MNDKRRMQVAGLVAVVAVAAWAAPGWAGTEKFTLSRAVPNDVFLFINGIHNPERAFIDAYWGEVFDALAESGIGEDVFGLVGTLAGEENKVALDEFVARGKELLDGVDWQELVGKEVAFFERLPKPNIGPGHFNMGPPDVALVFRQDAAGAAKSYDGLLALAEGICAEIAKASGEELPAFVKTEEAGVRIAEMSFFTLKPGARPFGFRIAQHGDLTIVTFGEDILFDVLELAAGKSPEKAIANDARFKAATAALPQAEDAIVYFDVQGMLNPIRELISGAVGQMAGPNVHILNAGMNKEASRLVGQSVAAYSQKDLDKALELIKKAHDVEPRDTIVLYNLACFNALAGNKDEALVWLDKAVDGGFHDPKKIRTDDDLASLREEPAFLAAVKKADEAVAQSGQKKAQSWAGLAKRLLDVPGIFDYVVSVEYTDGYTVHAETYVALVPEASSNPFYPVIANAKPVSAWDKFLPEETVSFSVTGGFDFAELYKFILKSVAMVGEDGDAVLEVWKKKQAEMGVDVERDFLSWMEGEFISVTLPGMQSGVFMMKVTDDELAREKVTAGLKFIGEFMTQAAEQNPMLAMFALRTAPLNNDKLEGFQRLFFGMTPAVWGVTDGYLIISMSEGDVVKCLATARGEHPSIRKSARAMSELLEPDGPFTSVSLTDYRNLGQELAGVIGLSSMMFGGLAMAAPDPEARAAIAKGATIVGKLSPIVAKIDFYKSVAAVSTFDGKAWRIKMATHYQSPEERNPTTAKAE